MKRAVYLGLAGLFLAPWLGIYVFLPNKKIDLTCQASYEMLKGVGGSTETRSHGTMISYYHPDGSGISRYTGTLQIENGDVPRRFTVHRTSHFRYELIGAFIKVTSLKTAKYVDDNADDLLVGGYVYPGFNVDSVEYFKIMKVGNGALAAGVGAMPRVYCEPLARSLSPP
jgi:hypothetical protein